MILIICSIWYDLYGIFKRTLKETLVFEIKINQLILDLKNLYINTTSDTSVSYMN